MYQYLKENVAASNPSGAMEPNTISLVLRKVQAKTGQDTREAVRAGEIIIGGLYDDL